MSDDDDDPVVEEIPVFLTHSLAEHLYVFQYPVVPCTNAATYNVVKSKIKPENEEVALEMGLDTGSPNFDQSHAEQIASAVDREKSSDTRLFSKKVMDKIFLESNRIFADSDSFGIGMMHGRELHISPIRSVLSLCPSFKHLDSKKEEPEVNGEENKLVRTDTRRNSYSNYTKKIAQEAWYHTEYYEPSAPKAQAERSRLSGCGVRTGVWLSSEGWELGWRGSVPIGGRGGVEELKTPPTLEAALTSLPNPLTLHQLSKTLISSIPAYFPPHDAMRFDDWLAAFLGQVLPYVVIVNGYFLPRSDLLYPSENTSKINGIPGGLMSRARDYILYELNEGRGLNRLSLSEVLKLPREEIDEILKYVATRVSGKWIFKLPSNQEFISRYSQVMEQQKLLWEARYKQVMESLETTAVAESKSPSQSKRKQSSSSISASPSKGPRT